MNVLMVGVDKTSKGGMLTVIENYLNDEGFVQKYHLKYVPTVTRGSKLKKIFFFLKHLFKIKKIIKKNNIDIVHIHMAERGSVYREGYVAKVSQKMGCKVVIHMHGATIEDWYNKQSTSKQAKVKKIFCLADRMIVLGENWRPFMSRVMGEESNRIVVLYNSVPIPGKNFYDANSHDILFYGMLSNRKGIDDLLLAFKESIPYISSNITLQLYGDDYDSQEKIGDKIHKFSLENRVVYNGWLTNDIKPLVFQKALIHVLPSYNEGLPMTILETMSYGIPNISTQIAAIPEVIEDSKNGLLINPGDVEKLKESIITLCNNDVYREDISKNAYKCIKDRFSFDVHMENLSRIYKDMIK